MKAVLFATGLLMVSACKGPAAPAPTQADVTAFLEAIERDPDSLPARFPEFVQMLRDAIDASGDDLAARRQLVATFTVAPVTAANLGLDASKLRVEAVERARALVARFPKDGRSHGVLASALGQNEAPASALIDAYTKCVELDPGASFCADSLESLRAAERAPRCSELKATFSLRGDNETLGASDVISAVLGDRGIDLVFTPAAAKKLEALTERLAKVSGKMSIMLGDETLLAAQVMAPIANGRVAVSPGERDPRELLERMCVKVIRQ